MKNKFERSAFVIRLIAIWRVITCRNIILIDFKETEIDNKPGRTVRTLYRSDYGFDSEILTLQAAILYTEVLQDEYDSKAN